MPVSTEPGKFHSAKVPCQGVAVCVEDVPLTNDSVRIRYSKSIRVASSRKVERGHYTFTEKKSAVITHKFSNHIAEIIYFESLALICTQQD